MQVLNSNHFYLNTPGCPNSWLHLASVGHGVREFMCFMSVKNGCVYIEEVTGGTGPDFIEDEELAKEIKDFLDKKNLLNITKPPIPDKEWYPKGKRAKPNKKR